MMERIRRSRLRRPGLVGVLLLVLLVLLVAHLLIMGTNHHEQAACASCVVIVVTGLVAVMLRLVAESPANFAVLRLASARVLLGTPSRPPGSDPPGTLVLRL